jgi:hypothetical protein
MGIPTVVIQRETFLGIMLGAIQGVGFSPEAAKVVFPTPLFMVDSDLTPLQERIDEVVAGLTKWEPETKEAGIYSPPKVPVEGRDYKEALTKLNYLFLNNLWGDGLPVMPATKEQVDWILTGTDLSPGTEIGRIAPRGGIANVETIAVALAMTGGRPEHLPVLIAIVEAIVTPETKLQNWSTGSGSAWPAVIVNGSIGQQIRLNSGFGLIGPHPQYPAGGTIGRALRFLLHLPGGAIPGLGAAGQYAQMRYTNAVFAEDEANFPAGWDTVATEYFGYPKGANVVTTLACDGVFKVSRRGSGIEPSLEVEQLESLYRVASKIKLIPKWLPTPDKMYGIYLTNALVAGQLTETGWTKMSIREKLRELTSFPRSELLARPDFVRDNEDDGNDMTTLPDLVPLWDKPLNLMITTAGGMHPTGNLFFMASGYSGALGHAEIKLPANWDALLAQAEEDLGPLPAG